MFRFSFLAATGLSLVLSATNVAAFELAHEDGTLQLDATPTRIASYDLGVLDSLQTLGIEVVGVPKSVYQGNLSMFNDAPVVGTLFEPDYPALKALDPDLIFTGSRSRAVMPELQKVAPTIEHVTDPLAFLDSFYENNRALGRGFGKEDEVETAIGEIETNVAQLKEKTEGKTAAFLFVIRDNIIVHAPGQRFGYAYELTGLQSVLPPIADTGQPPAPRPEPGSEAARKAQLERAKVVTKVAQADPDWLIVLDRGAINDGEKTAEATLVAHPELSQTRAFKNNNVYYADPNSWYIVTTGLSNLQQITADLLEKIQ